MKEKIEVQTVTQASDIFRPMIPYRDIYVYENNRIEMFDIKNNEKIPIKLPIQDIIATELYSFAIYPNIMGRDLYLQKIVNKTEPIEYPEKNTENYKSYITYIDFETTVKNIKIESGKMSLIVIEPNILEFNIIEIVPEKDVVKPYSKLIYLLRTVEYIPVDAVE